MAFTRILIFTLFVTLTLLETALTRITNEPAVSPVKYDSNKITGKWYVLGMITIRPPNEIPSCMTVDVTKENNVFVITYTARTQTGIRVSDVTRFTDTNAYNDDSGLVDFLDYISPNHDEAVIRLVGDPLRYFLLSRDPYLITHALIAKYSRIIRANNWFYSTIYQNNCY
ncbi:hypothetical protein PV325_009963 [Microctonus aethiopoides]|nr:hypothetical protein PV325_009963 [Microctonus aethiopoides]